MRALPVAGLVDLFRGEAEFALIDPREEGDFTHAHLLGAANLPFSRLELDMPEAIPNRSTPVVLVDDMSGPATRAADLLSDLGYLNLCCLDGGIAAWHASGWPLFSGVNVPGKAFGEYVEHHLKPPAISASDLKRRIDEGEPLTLIDTRTPAEHRDYCIPGAVLCPNGELSVRALDLIAASDAPVVTHCAGRTRSIIGAQTLIDLGVERPVLALENGTVGWEAIGAPLEHGADRPLADTRAARDRGREASDRLVKQAGIPKIDLSELRALEAEPDRTTVFIDVRDADAYARGHVPGARHVPGGQLIQNIDKYVIVRNARIVLGDDDGIRAGVVAFWLHRMGFEDVAILNSRPGDRTAVPQGGGAPQQGDQALPGEADLVVDVRSSLAYRRGHIPGSWYLSRAHLTRDLARLPNPGPVTIAAGGDESYAALVARDLALAGFQPRVVMNAVARWRERGLPLETGFSRLASPPNDMWYDGEHLEHAADAARENRRYIDWEKALIEDIADDPSVRYL